jgi:RNA polymerase sigma factor (sigma-70 family)
MDETVGLVDTDSTPQPTLEFIEENVTDALDLLPTPRPISFSDFYLEHFTSTARLAILLTSDAESARDITQDVFEGLHRHWHRVVNPEAYLRRSLSNRTADFHRRRARERSRQSAEPETEALQASELFDALNSLPSNQRSAVVMRFYLDLPDADIADALAVKVGTVASLVHRALQTLRKEIPK